MVPAAVGDEAAVRGPAVKGVARFDFVFAVVEEKTQPRVAFATVDPECVILIAAGEARVAGSPFAENVDEATRLFVEPDPGLDGERVAEVEVEDAFLTGVFEFQDGAATVEQDRCISGSEQSRISRDDTRLRGFEPDS